MSSIFRIQKTENYVILDKGFLNNNDLSWQAKGLLAYMLSMPNDWTFNVTDLATRSKNGRDATNNIIKELCAAGYVQKQQKREAGKFGATEFLVFETPQPITETPLTESQSTVTPLTENPSTDNPYTGKPLTENPYLLSNNKLNNNLLNIKDNDDDKEATPATAHNSESNQNSNQNAFTFYQSNGFGALSPYVLEKLNVWIEDLSDELVVHAMQIAVENNSIRWRYVETILRDWASKNFKTLEHVQADRLRFEAEKQRRQQQQKRPPRNYGRQEIVPDWLQNQQSSAPTLETPQPSINLNIDFEAERQKILKKLGG